MPWNRTQIERLPEAFDWLKEMQPERYGEETKGAMRDALSRVLKMHMDIAVDRYLEAMAAEEIEDRRNGSYLRHLLTGMGDLEVEVPRTRTFSAHAVLGAYARRSEEVDRAIMRCFLLGCATRKVGRVLLPMLGERVSPATVSRVTKVLDQAVKAFHSRPLKDRYRVLLLDGVVLSRKSGAGAVKRPVLVVLGLLPDGKKEVIDFRLAASESAPAWEVFLTDLVRRGLSGDQVELIVVDGGKGLLGALPTVFPNIPVQRCWAHKTRNLTDKVRKADREAVKKDLHRIYNAKNKIKASGKARSFANAWERKYPDVVRSLRNDLDELLACYCFKDPRWRRWTRTTNAIERRFREVRRRTRPMGVFTDRTSMDRILFAIFTNENQQQGVAPLFLVTQNR